MTAISGTYALVKSWRKGELSGNAGCVEIALVARARPDILDAGSVAEPDGQFAV